MANQATGATQKQVGKVAIVNGHPGRGTVVRVMGYTVEVMMEYGLVATDQKNVFVCG